MCPSGSQQLLIGGADNSRLNLFASLLPEPKGSGGSSYSSGSAAIQPKGGLFQGGVPKLRPVGAKDSSGNGHRPVVCVGVPGEGPEQEGVEDLAVFPWGFQLLRCRTPITSQARHRPAVPSLNLSPTHRPLGGRRSFVYCLNSVCSLWWPQSRVVREELCVAVLGASSLPVPDSRPCSLALLGRGSVWGQGTAPVPCLTPHCALLPCRQLH